MKKTYFDPINEMEKQIQNLISEKIREIYGLDVKPSEIKIETPPRKELGDLASPIGFLIAEKLGLTGKEKGKIIREAPTKIAEQLDLTGTLFKTMKPVGGYINFFINYSKLAKHVIANVINLEENYGKIDLGDDETVIVEHTSANPVHPLHIGTARNAVLGDTISRLLEYAGYKVRRHFYVNDMGKQVAYLVYGYMKLNHLKPTGKADHWLGIIYSCVNVLSNTRNALKQLEELKGTLRENIEKLIEKLEKETDLEDIVYKLKSLKYRLNETPTTDWRETITSLKTILSKLESESENTYSELINEEKKNIVDLEKKLNALKEWLEIESEIKSKWGEIYEELDKKTIEEDIEQEVSKIVKKYEEGDTEMSKLFKEVCETALIGFRETLNKIGIKFDSFDWESELVRKGEVKELLNKLIEKGWAEKENNSNALFLNIRKAITTIDKVAELFNLTKEKAEKLLKEGKIKELPPNLPLTRSDGTTLYTTRDISYSIQKFEKWKAKKVFNVIGVDQTLAQKQLRAALILAGYPDYADNQIHLAYELVTLPGKKFSSRRGRYITFDEVFEEVKTRAYEEIHKRWPTEEKKQKEKTAEKIAIGAIRYSLIEVSPTKKITFQWNRVLDFEQNSGPFLQYAYVRALNILKKAENIEINSNVNLELLKEEEEKELIMRIAKLPKKIKEAIYFLRPDILAEYANKLAQTFNKFYQKHRVLQAETPELRQARLALVKAYVITFGNVLELLGIPRLEKM